MRQVNRLRDRHFGPLPAQAGLEALIERLAQPFLMHLKATLAQSGSSHWARCLARLDMAGTLTAPDQPADSRWQNSLLTTLSAIRQSLPADEADFIADLLFNSLLRGLSRIEQGISDDGWPIDSLHHHGSALQSALLGLLNTTTQAEATHEP